MIEVRIAETEADREAIFRLRYKVYIEEMRRDCHADHDRGLITDVLDNTAILLYAKNGAQVVGTVRTNLRKHGNVELETEYALRDFAPYYPDHVSCSGKLIVATEFRCSRAAFLLSSQLFEIGRKEGVCFDFINVNPPLDEMYARFGYRRYRSDFPHPDYGCVTPMVLVLTDIAHMENIGSPFRQVARQYQDHDLSAQWFHNHFGQQPHAATQITPNNLAG